ncbi:MAG: hypothetical protein GF388_10070 [Candidatus Aegiribacteria sp.]|nr:hypothetical protein [Candidatus Aegiribacteria sp.]MBD3295378.1 hypothetical protein [Candidatus Fermentibacteria bacterium]
MTALLILLLLNDFVTLDRIVALVGDSPVLHSEVVHYMQDIAGGSSESDPAGSSRYMEVLEELVEEQLIMNAAIESGYYPAENEIPALVEAELAQNPSASASDPELLAERVAENYAAQTFLGRKVQARLQQTPVSPETYLMTNPELVDQLVMPRHLGWIYLPVLPSGPDYDSALAEITEIREEILQGGSFEDLAREYSDDGSAQNGGYLGTFGPGEMTFAFENAAFDLEVGQISEPVPTPFGIHLIRMDGRNSDATIEASHILISVEVDSLDIEKTLAKADEILGMIASDSLSFQEAARLYSTDRSSSGQGGDLGTIPLKFWQPEVAAAAETLGTGEISRPVLLIEDGAVVIVRMMEDSGAVQWDSYTEAELSSLVQQVIFQDTYNTVVDSLREEIPVIYYAGDADQIED